MVVFEAAYITKVISRKQFTVLNKNELPNGNAQHNEIGRSHGVTFFLNVLLTWFSLCR